MAVQGEHQYLIAVWPGAAVDIERDEPPCFKVGADHVRRHASPAEAGLEEFMLGSKVCQPPGFRRDDAELFALREVGTIRQDELDMLRKLFAGNRRRRRSERMAW